MTGPWAPGLVLAPALLLVASAAVLLRPGSARRAGALSLLAVLLSALPLTAAWVGRRCDVILWAPGTAEPGGTALALRLDGLSIPFVANLFAVSLLAFWYALGYLERVRRPEWCYSLLLVFVASMLGGLLADDLLLFLVSWEAMLLASALLLVGWGEGPRASAVTLRYFIYSQGGSLLLIAAMAWLAHTSGSTQPEAAFRAIRHQPLPVLQSLGAMLFVGFAVKMAIVPVHGWLPDAHAIAPMPVTILLAGAMLAMGAYGMLRFALLGLGPAALMPLQAPLMALGLVSQVYGAWQSLGQRDLKRFIAYSSVSQMGYVLFGIAALSSAGASASVHHILGHGLVKSLLFMAAGVVIASTSRRRMSGMAAIGRLLPVPALSLSIGLAATAGFPPLLGFHTEWRLLLAGLEAGHPLLAAGAFAAPVATLAYALVLVARMMECPAHEPPAPVAAPRPMQVSTGLALALVLLAGFLGGPLGRWIADLLPEMEAVL